MKTERFLLVRITTSRGTDDSACIEVGEFETYRDAAERWSDKYVQGTAIHEYSVSFKRIILPRTRSQLLKKWDKVCDRYGKAKLARDETLALLNAFDRQKAKKTRTSP